MAENKDVPPRKKGEATPAKRGLVLRFLDGIEVAGNKLPDPAALFLIGLILVWVLSWLLSGVAFGEIDPRTGEPIEIVNLLTGTSLAAFFANMVQTFAAFPPLGLVLVALLGVGVAEHVGFINAGLKALLGVTPKALLTPMLILVACVSHTAADAGYVLVIPLGGVIFYAAGRHPLAGIAAAFAGVSGGFSANFIPSGIDPLLQSFTQSAAQILDPERLVNPLCNIYFTAASTLLVVLIGWYLTDRVVEPRLANTPVEVDPEEDVPDMSETTLAPRERRGLWLGIGTLVLLTAGLVLAAMPGSAYAQMTESRCLAVAQSPYYFDNPPVAEPIPGGRCNSRYAMHVKGSLEHVAALVYSGSAVAAVFSGDLVTLFVFWEGTAVSSVFLIWGARTEASLSAGNRVASRNSSSLRRSARLLLPTPALCPCPL